MHVANIAPQEVSGHLVRYQVQEHGVVAAGQLLDEIDPVPPREQVALLQANVQGAAVVPPLLGNFRRQRGQFGYLVPGRLRVVGRRPGRQRWQWRGTKSRVCWTRSGGSRRRR
jgi:multidrug efflux pump subunit AcrA (membrane-fusion protein)